MANSIHTRPEEARELLTEFAEFTRYAFRGNRSYVTLADELHYVEKYLRLEQARFGDRLDVRVSVAPEVLTAVVPVLSMQPLVENAVRHGVESALGPCRVEILGADLDADVELTVKDGGAGMSADEAAAALAGPRRGHRAGERPRAPAVDVRPRVRARGRIRARRGNDRPHARPEVPRGGARRVTLRVLAVDDERPALDDLARVLRAQPAVAEVDTAASGEEALHALTGGEHYDAVFLDVRMPGLDGVELARVLRRFASPPALIFVSAYESAAVEAFELRALDYLLKPVVAGAGGRGARARRREAGGRGHAGHARGRRRRRRHAARPPRRRALPAVARRLRARRHRRTAASSCAGRWARSSAAGSRTASTACTGASWSTCGRAVEVRPQLNGTALLILADGAELPIARREVAELRRRLRT